MTNKDKRVQAYVFREDYATCMFVRFNRQCYDLYLLTPAARKLPALAGVIIMRSTSKLLLLKLAYLIDNKLL